MHHNPAAVKARSALLLMLALLLAACQAAPQPRAIDTTRAAQGDIASWPAGREFIVDTEASDLRIVVESAGRLARFGHPHVLGGPVLSGRVVLSDDWTASALELSIALENMVLDKPEWRIAEGFPPELPDGAIEATRENLMSAAVLDVANHPTIQIRSLGLIGPAFQPDLEVRITLRGAQRDLTVPISLHADGDSLIATGRFAFLQSEFGLEPFSALGGALAVSDKLLVRFRIVARARS
ncbi:MAG: YceI family protein [Wenzhouxiangella sp.]